MIALIARIIELLNTNRTRDHDLIQGIANLAFWARRWVLELLRQPSVPHLEENITIAATAVAARILRKMHSCIIGEIVVNANEDTPRISA
jgi:hypothetical protein